MLICSRNGVSYYYLSPFATAEGISKCKPAVPLLKGPGFQYWTQMLDLCPRVELIFGHGQGWEQIERHFDVELKDLPTGFEGRGQPGKHLSFAKPRLMGTRRPVLIYWWHQNYDGKPLCSLDAHVDDDDVERRKLGTIVAKHALRHGVRLRARTR
jgi:hypothetical protein